ncbi:hypothetical protein K1719_035515 [Acacia pycnantha]|nr:hypothetical protein K1719_035515 [Acacia pycnantha]
MPNRPLEPFQERWRKKPRSVYQYHTSSQISIRFTSPSSSRPFPSSEPILSSLPRTAQIFRHSIAALYYRRFRDCRCQYSDFSGCLPSSASVFQLTLEGLVVTWSLLAMWVALYWNHGGVGVLFLDFWGRSEAD